MNIWQRLSILGGSITIAILFWLFPYEYKKEVLYHPNPNNPRIERYKEQKFIDYRITLLEASGIIAITCGVTVLLGSIKKNHVNEDQDV